MVDKQGSGAPETDEEAIAKSRRKYDEVPLPFLLRLTQSRVERYGKMVMIGAPKTILDNEHHLLFEVTNALLRRWIMPLRPVDTGCVYCGARRQKDNDLYCEPCNDRVEAELAEADAREKLENERQARGECIECGEKLPDGHDDIVCKPCDDKARDELEGENP